MKARELVRFALGGLWRQKVRTILTLIGVTVGTCALAFSLALGFGLRAFIDNEFQGRDDFWRIHVHLAEPPADPATIPPEKIAVTGQMSADRRERIRQALIEKYQTTSLRKPPVLLTPDKLAAIAALPDVREVRAARSTQGRIWVNSHSAVGLVVAGRVADLAPRVIAGRLPDPEADEMLVSEFTLYEAGVRDDTELEALVGQSIQVDAGGVRTAQPMALARALTGRSPIDEQLSLGQSKALEKLTAVLPDSLDKLDLTPAEKAELRSLLAARSDPADEIRLDSGKVASGRFKVAGVLRLVTKEDRKKADPLSRWQMQGDVILPPAAGEKLFTQLPWAREMGFFTAEVMVRPGGDLQGTVDRIEGMGYETFSALKWFGAAKREVTLIAGGLNLFSFIALFVAGIGIMNTLITSVVERTREIGILKAVGATRTQVLGIFLMEGAVIGLIGSGLGLGLARLLAIPADRWVHGYIEKQIHGERLLSETVFVFPWWLWVASSLFAVLLTTAAAYYPARRAAKIDPIQALKYE
ncbi:MAG TPA: ABC transporter permease [Gemmataceae bacterium]|nr:ABC transporter permease [Gemmataceae bacterium]